MADFQSEFKAKLKAISAITDLVGEGVYARIYPDVLKQNAKMPAIVYAEAAGGESFEHLEGPVGVAETVFHVTSYAATREAANALAEVVRVNLQGPINANFNETYVSSVTCYSHRSAGVDWTADKQAIRRYWMRRIFRIYHDETTS